MEGAIFGSYSLTEFKDLYELNIRDNHECMIFEVDGNGISRIHSCNINDLNNKDTNSTYLIGITTEITDNLTIGESTIEYLESPHSSRNLDYLVSSKKEYIYFVYEDSLVTFVSSKKLRVYTSENRSFSTLPVHGFVENKPNLIHTIPIFRDNKFLTDRSDYGYE